jgi:GH25 family lysozyme M1 (1,4-beta-N-acetylmuramidase)
MFTSAVNPLAWIVCALGVASILPLQTRGAGRELGADVSHYQGASGISQSAWNQMFADGKRFAYIKATEGLTGPDDAAMNNNVLRASAAGLLVGVYHYAHPENRTNTAGAIQEADHFLSYSGTAIGPGRLRPVLDLEGSSASLSKTGLTDWVIAFHDRIKEQRGAGAAPIIYVNRSYAASELDSRVAAYDLWLAYPTNVDATVVAPPPTSAYPDPTGVFNNWSFWQYSWTGSSGGISPLDLDVCHSEYKPLSSFLIPTPSPIFALKIKTLGAGSLQLSFTNIAGTRFTMLAASTFTLPVGSWTVLGSATEISPGSFQFTDTTPAGTPRRFYRARSP